MTKRTMKTTSEVVEKLTNEQLVDVLKTKLSPNELYHLFTAIDEDGDMSFYGALGEEAKKARPEEFVSSEENEHEEKSR